MKYIKVLLWIIVAVLMAAIFLFSAQPASQSNDVSQGITERIVDSLPNTKNMSVDEKETIISAYNSVVRKYAHFTLYLLLGIFTIMAIRNSFFDKRIIYLWLISILICLVYAISDEVHQIFVMGRASQFIDVLIDLSGSLVGSGIVVAIIGKNK